MSSNKKPKGLATLSGRLDLSDYSGIQVARELVLGLYLAGEINKAELGAVNLTLDKARLDLKAKRAWLKPVIGTASPVQATPETTSEEGSEDTPEDTPKDSNQHITAAGPYAEIPRKL